jgi:phosphohistidine phosphatase
MPIYLVQHGKSRSKDLDPERGLSDEGRAETEKMAELAGSYGLHVSAIKHSGKKRALQTAGIFAKALRPEDGIAELKGINPMDDPAVLGGVIETARDWMIVGHLPFLARLVSYLIIGSTEKPVFQFQNSGIVCLDRDPDEGDWIIKWALIPHIS